MLLNAPAGSSDDVRVACERRGEPNEVYRTHHLVASGCSTTRPCSVLPSRTPSHCSCIIISRTSRDCCALILLRACMERRASEVGESSSSGSRRRVSLPASGSYPFLFAQPQVPSTTTSSPSSTPHSFTSSPGAGPSRLPSSASSPVPTTRIFARPQPVLSLSQPSSAGPSRLHQRAKSSGYGGIGKGKDGVTALSRSISTGPSTSSQAGGVDPSSSGAPVKRARKMWTEEETQQLADGCNKVSPMRPSWF
jgi:hypothetical protein